VLSQPCNTIFSQLDGTLNTVIWNDISPLSFNTDGSVGKYGYDAWLGGWKWGVGVLTREWKRQRAYTVSLRHVISVACVELPSWPRLVAAVKRSLSDKPAACSETPFPGCFSNRKPFGSRIPASEAILTLQSTVTSICKAFPLQAWTGPWGSWRWRLRNF
jgi:hypothetical protein